MRKNATTNQIALTKPSHDRQKNGPILLIVGSCIFAHITRQVSNVIAKISKEERSELKWKLESMEDKEDVPEVDFSVMPNLQMESPAQLNMNSHPQNS